MAVLQDFPRRRGFDRFFNIEARCKSRETLKDAAGGTAKRFGFNVQQREPFLTVWGEDENGRIGKGRKEVNILRRRERWSRQRPKMPGGA